MKAAACAAAAGLCAGLAQSAPDTFDNYLVDVGPGHVSAGEMLKVSSSAITPIESPKDIVALLNFAGTDEGRKGFGLAVTPARTSLVPLAVQTYLDNPWARLWGGTTFSYAQDRQSLQGTEYRRQALAVNVSYYLDKQEDPHVIARQAFIGCQKQLQPRMAAETARIMALVQGLPPEQVAAAVERIKSEPQRFLPEANAIVRQCFQAAGKPTWNATQFALSAGQAWIRPPGSGGERLSLARTLAISATHGFGTDSLLLNGTLRRSDRQLDLSTLGATPRFDRSTIAAARLTYGHGDARDLYGLVEVSNARSSRTTLPDAVFKFALGIDKRIAEGIWVEFRVGRRHNIDDGREETAGLLNLKLSPTTSLPKALAPL